MSKWYKVLVPLTEIDDIREVGQFLDDLKPIGRLKATYRREYDRRSGLLDEIFWCFKFKDADAAAAFKLRWL